MTWLIFAYYIKDNMTCTMHPTFPIFAKGKFHYRRFHRPVLTASRLPFFCFRGHTVRAVSESFQMSKDAGFKVVAHMMPDLPNVDLERDVEQFIVSYIVK